jgi:DNA (cytosine-5)-methyltransferase 1
MSGIVTGSHSSAFWGFVQILKAQGSIAPPLVLVENVPGWLVSNKGKDFRVTVTALNDLGYACDVFILDALRFTPQSRLRVFLVGSKIRLTNTTVELLLTRPKSLLSDQLRKCIVANKDLRWFYNDLCAPPPLNTCGLSQIVERLDEKDDRWWSAVEVKRHLAMMNEAHRERVEGLKNGVQLSYRTFFRRRRNGNQRAEVRDDDLSGCLRTAVGGSGKQFLVEAGQGTMKMRAMTPREYARLQGVPDHFPIRVNGVQALTGFGDAVCVPAIAWIANHVLTPLAKQPSPGQRLETRAAQLFLFDRNDGQP